MTSNKNNKIIPSNRNGTLYRHRLNLPFLLLLVVSLLILTSPAKSGINLLNACLFNTNASIEEQDTEQNHPNGTDDLFSMSIEELMEVPVVVSASRIEQKTANLSVPVTIITAEDISASGLTNIPEILTFATGVDVTKFSRNNYAVGIRGMHGIVSDRTLILINGRVIDNPVLGTIDWLNFPVFVEDIQRIEVVRGPASASWGANALTGAINIITKKPKDIQGAFVSSTLTEFGDNYTHLRYAQTQDKWSWKISAGYEDTKDSDSAGSGMYYTEYPALSGLMGFNSYTARDFSRSTKIDSEFIYQQTDQTKLSFGAVHSNINAGDYEVVGYFPREDYLTSLTRMFARIDHVFDNGNNAYLQWFSNFCVSHSPNIIPRYSFNENDVEYQYNFKAGTDHDLSVGGNVRWTRITTTNSSTTNENIFHGSPYSEDWIGFFAIDRWLLNDRMTLENQVRYDIYSHAHPDWSMRSSAIYSLDDAKDHILRMSYARAFRAPVVGIRNTSSSSLSGLFLTQTPLKDMYNESAWALEAGYTGKLEKDLTLNINTYYQRFEQLTGVRNSTVGAITTSTFDNISGANSWGTECEIAHQTNKMKLSAWYAYCHLETDEHDQNFRALYPARHKTGLTARYNLNSNWTFNTNYTYTDNITTHGSPLAKTPTCHRLDLTLSRKIGKGNGTFMVGVTDLLNKTEGPSYSTPGFTAHETPGRTFFTRLQWTF